MGRIIINTPATKAATKAADAEARVKAARYGKFAQSTLQAAIFAVDDFAGVAIRLDRKAGSKADRIRFKIAQLKEELGAILLEINN